MNDVLTLCLLLGDSSREASKWTVLRIVSQVLCFVLFPL